MSPVAQGPAWYGCSGNTQSQRARAGLWESRDGAESGPLPLFLLLPTPVGIFTPFSVLTSSSSGKPARSSLLLPVEMIAGFPCSLRPLTVTVLVPPAQWGGLLCRGPKAPQAPSHPQTCSDQADSKGLREWPLVWHFGHVILSELQFRNPCLWVVKDLINMNSCPESPLLCWVWLHRVLRDGSVSRAGHSGQNRGTQEPCLVDPGGRLLRCRAPLEPEAPIASPGMLAEPGPRLFHGEGRAGHCVLSLSLLSSHRGWPLDA